MADFDPAEFDPEEIVRFDNKDRSLLTVVRQIMSVPRERRNFVAAILRGPGKKPSLLEAADIEKIAQLPAFKEQ